MDLKKKELNNEAVDYFSGPPRPRSGLLLPVVPGTLHPHFDSARSRYRHLGATCSRSDLE